MTTTHDRDISPTARTQPRIGRAARLLLACVVLAIAGCSDDVAGKPRAVGDLPPDDKIQVSVPSGAVADDLKEIILTGLDDTEGKSRDFRRFVIIRAGDRHGSSFRSRGFHVLVGAGITLPDGAMRIRRKWNTAGMVDGRNEEPERCGVSICVEPGAPYPFSPAVTMAVREFCRALTREVPIHPHLVVAMQEIPNTVEHEADAAERTLAAAAREVVPVPPARFRLTVVRESDGKKFPVAYELCDTEQSRPVGMMLRRRFDGPNRGMVFEYPFRKYCGFYMRNCFIPIDLAFVRKGVIEDVFTMKPLPGISTRNQKWYNSSSAVKFALEMPAGWFKRHGVKVGDKIEFHPR